ncbi:MAG: PQQ-binding-like beta-propeller repeat protein [Planctomycetaceae bacterium]|nr:PQQ-binding-like beta-propeller repeat protein [Planctomycetaceae bacterium]
MLTLAQLVEILQQTQVIAPSHLNRLRRIAEASPSDFTPTIALKWLIEQKQLTAAQAERLVVAHDPQLADSLQELHDDTPLPLDDAPLPRDLSTSPQIPVRTPWSQPIDPAGPAAPPEAPTVPEAPAPAAAAPQPEAHAPTATPAPAIPVAAAAIPVAVRATPVPVTPTRGPLDDLLDAALSSSAAWTGTTGVLGAPPLVKRRAGTWDSPLLLAGGGALLLMIFVGIALWFSLGRESGDELLRLADEDVRQGAFDQAIFKYNRFDSSLASHPRASYARVQRGMAKLRKAVDTTSETSDWPANLKLAQQVVDEIGKEANFADARPELAALLPQIAEQLAKAAVESDDAAQLDAARESYELATKPQLIPEALRPVVKLQEVEQLLRLAERRHQKAQSLEKTALAIVAAAGNGDFAAGFDLQRQLLVAYPDLRTNDKLTAAMQTLSGGLRDAVKHERVNIAAQTGEPDTAVRRAVTPILYGNGIPAEPVDDGAWVVVQIRDAAYGLDAATGRVLWRRYIGPSGYAQRIDVTPQSDALLVDAVNTQLVRLDARTGTVRWRTPFEQSITAAPTIVRGAAIVVTSGGRLHQVDLASGAITEQWRLPQEIATSPSVDPREDVIYVVVDHSHLFVLSRGKQACVEVMTVGHASGQIIVPPLVMGRYLFLAQNLSSVGGKLLGMLTNTQGLELKPFTSQQYNGQVTTPLVAQGRTLALVNEFGTASVYEVSPAEPTPALNRVLEVPGDNQPPQSRYLQLVGGTLTIGGYEVTINELQPSRGRFSRQWSSGGTEGIVTAPQTVDGRVIYVRQAEPQGAVLIEGAENITAGKRWQTRLAGPVTVDTLVDNQSLRLLTSIGDTVRVERESPESVSLASAVHLPTPHQAVIEALPLDDKRWLALTRDQRLLVIDVPAKTAKLLHDQVPGGTAVFEDHVLVPRLSGEIEALQRTDLSRSWQPFQPRLTPGVDYHWTRPAIAADGQSFVVSDRRTQLYRVGLKSQPQVHLAAVAAVTTTEPVESAIIAGSTVYGRDGHGRVLAFALEDLKPGASWDLKVTPDAGPWSVGKRALAVSAAGELWCFDQGKEAWQVAWPQGALAGEPLLLGNDAALLATRAGEIWHVDLKSGATQRHVSVHQALRGAMTLVGDQLLVTSTDGTLLWLDAPRSQP